MATLEGTEVFVWRDNASVRRSGCRFLPSPHLQSEALLQMRLRL